MFTTRKNLGPAAASSAPGGPAPLLPFAFASLSLAGTNGPARMRHPGFASLSLAIPGQSKNAAASPSAVKEAITGLEFGKEYCPRGPKDCTGLAGLGVRAKRILGIKNINVYAVGLYVDARAAKSKLVPKFKGMDQEKLSKNCCLMKEFVAAEDVEKTVRLLINYGGITPDQFWDALKRRMEPSLKEAGEMDTLAKFGAQFDNVKFRKGLDISFNCKGKTMVTRIDGKEVGKISSPALNRTLLDIYVGSEPVSEDAKANFQRGLASMMTEK